MRRKGQYRWKGLGLRERGASLGPEEEAAKSGMVDLVSQSLLLTCNVGTYSNEVGNVWPDEPMDYLRGRCAGHRVWNVAR